MVNKWKAVKQRCSPPSSWFTFLHMEVSQRQHCPVRRMSLGLPTFSAYPSISLGINIYRLWGGCPLPPDSLKTKALGVLWGCGGLRVAWTSSLALEGTLENTGYLSSHPLYREGTKSQRGEAPFPRPQSSSTANEVRIPYTRVLVLFPFFRNDVRPMVKKREE